MKYQIKKARGFCRVTKFTQHGYTIMAQGTTIPRITYEPVRTFATLYTVNRVFSVWKPRPEFLPRFIRRCV